MLEQQYEQPQKKVNSAMIAAMEAIKVVFGPQASRLFGTPADLAASHAALTTQHLMLLPSIWTMQEGPVAGLRSLGLDLINQMPALKQTIQRVASAGTGL